MSIGLRRGGVLHHLEVTSNEAVNSKGDGNTSPDDDRQRWTLGAPSAWERPRATYMHFIQKTIS
jgi:hypothetical protein